MLPPSDKHQGLDAGKPVESVHPTDRSRSSFPHPQAGFEPASYLAPERRPRAGAHIMVCFLAYVLWKCLAQMCKHAGLGNEPRTILEEINNLTLVDVVLMTRTGTEITFRCVSKPEDHLAILLQKLNLRPPERLEMKLKM
jgi:hypothetical protein